MDEAFKIFRNTFSSLAIRFSGSFATFVVTLLITSKLGLFELGSFVKVTSFVALFYLMIDFGINTVYLRDNFHDAEKNFGNLIFLRLIISTAVFLIVVAFTSFLPEGINGGFTNIEKIAIVLYSLTLFTEGILVSFTGLLQKRLMQHILLIPSIVSAVVVLIIVFIGVANYSLLVIILSYPIAELIQVIITFFIFKNKNLIGIVSNSFISFSKKTIIAAVPLAIMLFLNVIYFRADIFILSLLKPTEDVGAYGFSYKLFEFLIAFPTFLTASMFPILIEHKDNYSIFYKKVQKYLVNLFAISLIISLCVFLFAPLILILGNNTQNAVTPLKILSASLPFFFITSLLQWVLLLKKRISFLILTYAVTMAINIILNIFLIPKYSFIASAYITVFTEAIVFMSLFSYFLYLKNRGK